MTLSNQQDVEAERVKLELRLLQLETQERATSSFLDFCRYVWPEMIVGEHHRRIAKKLDDVVAGRCKRLMIAMPPRHGKSQMGSYLFPAYLMGKRPDSKLIVGSHTAELAQRFGRMIRNLVAEERYRELFPDFSLSADSKAAGRWDTNAGGEAFFIGKGGAMTGRGGNVVILDDILDEQDALSDTAMEGTWEWYTFREGQDVDWPSEVASAVAAAADLGRGCHFEKGVVAAMDAQLSAQV